MKIATSEYKSESDTLAAVISEKCVENTVAKVHTTRLFQSFKEWAKENTPEGTVFHPDPNINYAWRDFSERPSFGTPREFVTSWIYTQDLGIFNESIERLSIYDDKANELIFSLEIEEYGEYFSKRYYENEDVSIFLKLSKLWNVEYFIWDKMYNTPEILTIVFETDEHFILKIKE